MWSPGGGRRRQLRRRCGDVADGVQWVPCAVNNDAHEGRLRIPPAVAGFEERLGIGVRAVGNATPKSAARTRRIAVVNQRDQFIREHDANSTNQQQAGCRSAPTYAASHCSRVPKPRCVATRSHPVCLMSFSWCWAYGLGKLLAFRAQWPNLDARQLGDRTALPTAAHPGAVCGIVGVGAPLRHRHGAHCAGPRLVESRWSTVAHSPAPACGPAGPASRVAEMPSGAVCTPAWATPAGPRVHRPQRTRTAALPARSPSSTTASSRTSPSCAGGWGCRCRVCQRHRYGAAHLVTRGVSARGGATDDFIGSVLTVLRRRGHSRSCSPNAAAPSWRKPQFPRPGAGHRRQQYHFDIGAFIVHREKRSSSAGPGGGDHRRRLDQHGRLAKRRSGLQAGRTALHIDWDLAAAEKGGYEYFMLRRSPNAAVADTLLGPLRGWPDRAFDEQRLSARSTRCSWWPLRYRAYHSGLLAKYTRSLDAAARGSGTRQRVSVSRSGVGP